MLEWKTLSSLIPSLISTLLMSTAFSAGLTGFAPPTDILPLQQGHEIALENWQPEQGDIFVADTMKNMGYLVHTNGDFVRDAIASGKRGLMHWMGMTYNATTPTGHFVALEKGKKGDRITYGEEGTYLRLFKDGTKRTHYLIHAYYKDRMHETADRYRSAGCIVPRKKYEDMIVQTYETNNHRLDVVITYGLLNKEDIQTAMNDEVPEAN